MNIISIVSISLAGLILIGFLLGFWRSWKKSLIRFSFIIVSFLVAFLLSQKLSELLMKKYVDGFVISIFGLTLDLESVIGEIAKDLLYEGSALTNLTTALMNIALRLVAFLIIFVAMFVVTLLIYWIISAIMSTKKRRNSVGDEKEKIWKRFIGAGIGLVSTLVICIVLFSPFFGLMNICDKFLKDDNKNTASAYNETCFVAGKFYTENKNIGQIESYLQKYDDLRTDYKKSFAGVVFTYSGVDFLGETIFSKLSTVNQNGVVVNLTEESVNIVNVYNIYKTNFVESKFDLATEQSVKALEDIYGIAKNSEVMKSIIADIVPNMTTKWSNGEKFLGMELPVNDDSKELVIEILKPFKSKEFVILDRNFNVLFDAIKTANSHKIIESVNNGSAIIDVIDAPNFVKDEIEAIATTPEFRRALPNVMTTVVKIAYKSSIGDPETKLNQEFTQEDLALIVWSDEAEITQTIVTRTFKFIKSEDIINNLTDIGVVIDSARKSKILSNPVKIFVLDYISLKADKLGDSKQIIIDAINNNWNNLDYRFEDLFATIETTVKVAKELSSMDLIDLKETIRSLLNNDTTEKVKETIELAIKNGAFNSLIGDNEKADVYNDLILNVLENTDKTSIDKDLLAGQVIVDIINSPKTEQSSVLDNYGNSETTKEDKADVMIETLVASDTIMDVLKNEADKVENEQDSQVKEYINNLDESDKNLLKSSIDKIQDGEKKATLKKLFGN